jgi:hypothetical protein
MIFVFTSEDDNRGSEGMTHIYQHELTDCVKLAFRVNGSRHGQMGDP